MLTLSTAAFGQDCSAPLVPSGTCPPIIAGSIAGTGQSGVGSGPSVTAPSVPGTSALTTTAGSGVAGPNLGSNNVFAPPGLTLGNSNSLASNMPATIPPGFTASSTPGLTQQSTPGFTQFATPGLSTNGSVTAQTTTAPSP